MYNGYSNRATWNVCLWVLNDEKTYKYIKENKPFNYESALFFCHDLFGDKTPDGDKLNEVNWNEVSEIFNQL